MINQGQNTQNQIFSLYNFKFLDNLLIYFRNLVTLSLSEGHVIDHRANSSLHSEERMSAAEGSFFPHGATAVPLHWLFSVMDMCICSLHLLQFLQSLSKYSVFLSFSPLQVPNKTTGHWTFFYHWKPGRWQISSPKQPLKVRPALNRETI